MRVIQVILVLISLTGCATAPTNAPMYSSMKIPEATDRTAIVVMYRTMTPPTAFHMPVLVNDNKVIEIPNESFTWVEVPAGENEITIDWPIWVGIRASTLKANFEANKTHFVKLGGNIFFEESLLECCRYVPAK